MCAGAQASRTTGGDAGVAATGPVRRPSMEGDSVASTTEVLRDRSRDKGH
jgi:hypothetical protein